ncbi:unnamed protein product, partial [marine sediment metagenome]
ETVIVSCSYYSRDPGICIQNLITQKVSVVYYDSPAFTELKFILKELYFLIKKETL